MDVRWTCVTLDGGPSDGEDPSEVSRISSSETGEDSDLSRCPKSPIHHHCTGRRRTSVENGSAMTSGQQNHRSLGGGTTEDGLALAVVLT